MNRKPYTRIGNKLQELNPKPKTLKIFFFFVEINKYK